MTWLAGGGVRVTGTPTEKVSMPASEPGQKLTLAPLITWLAGGSVSLTGAPNV